MDNQSLAHSRYNCTYYIVFIPKYRGKVMFGDMHMYVPIPPKESVAKMVGRIRGKSNMMSKVCQPRL